MARMARPRLGLLRSPVAPHVHHGPAACDGLVQRRVEPAAPCGSRGGQACL